MFGQAQQGFGPNPYQYQPGMAPYGTMAPGMPYATGASQQQSAVLNNFLSPEQMSEIQQYPQQFPTKLTKDEFLRSICTHKANGRITLEHTQDGQHHCTICAKDFFLFDLNTSDEVIYGICKNMHDLLQSIKTYLLNAPDALKDIYMMLGFIEKLPLLWKSAVKTFEQASNATAFGLQQNYNQDSFQMLGAMFGGGGGMMGGFYNQPAPQVPPMAVYQQPGYASPTVPPPQAPILAPQAAPGQPPYYGQQQGFGFNQNNFVQQPAAPIPPMTYSQPAPPPGYPAAGTNSSMNPVGYIETPGAAPGVASTQVSISPGQQMALPNPEPAPVNPNLQNPVERTDVNKTFAPKAS